VAVSRQKQLFAAIVSESQRGTAKERDRTHNPRVAGSNPAGPTIPTSPCRRRERARRGVAIVLLRIRSPVLPSAIAVALFVAAVWYARSSTTGETVHDAERFAGAGCTMAADMFKRHQSAQWVTLSGVIQRRLNDTYGRFQHQRFILGCAKGLHVLVVNDVSVGQRVPIVARSRITVRGQYVWDSQGGLVHFTHHADGGETSGWILFGSHIYQ
jgi:hypothetical protein